MKFSFTRNHAAVLMTLFFVIFLGASYFFIYVPNNEKYLQEQRFRWLQNIDRGIRGKVQNSVNLMNTVDTGYIEYLNAHSKQPFILSRLGNQQAKLLNESGDTITVSGDTINISDLNRGMTMKWSFNQFMESLLPKNVFDQYIIFSDGEAVFETFPSGISYLKDSLSDKKKGIVSTNIRSLNVSGTDYKLFSHPISFAPDNEWVISGLLSNKRYQQEKNQLPANGVLLLVTVLLIIIVVFPWVKLYQMGNKDRLTLTDGILSMVVSMLLMSLLFFTFFKYNVALRPDTSPNSKETLASQITTAFQNEIDTAYQKLRSFDDSLKNHSTLFSGDIINLNDSNKINFKDSIKSRIPLAHDSLKTLQAIAKTISVSKVNWLDENGQVKINWTTNSENVRGNFKNRDYFKKIQNKEYILPNDTTRRFYLDQVISWIDGSFTSIISVPSKVLGGNGVAAMSFTMRSVNKPVLPEGYQFAIIDNKGNVLYHSDSARNLNENLLDEFSEKEKLESNIEARTEDAFTTKYFTREYNVTVKPVEKLPYFIIIFDNTSYEETRDIETYSFTFSMLSVFFGFLVIQLFAIFLVSAKRSFFKKQLFDTSWIGPKISCHQEYTLSAIFNCIIIFLLILFFNNSTFLEYLFILLVSVTFIPLFLNIIFAIRYSREKRNVLQFKKLAIYSLCTLIVIIGIIASRMLDLRNFIYLLLYEILVSFLGLWLYSMKRIIYQAAHQLKESKRCKVLFGKWNYVNSFVVMALTRLVITSGLPVVFFYISSYNYEQNLIIRHKQVDFADHLVNKFPSKSPDTIFNANNKWNGIYYDSSLVNHVSVISRDTALTHPGIKPYSKEELRTIQLLKLFRLYLTDEAIIETDKASIEDKFYTPGAPDNSFFFNHLLKDACANGNGTITYRQSSLPYRYLKIQSENLNYHYPSVFTTNKFNGALFWILLFVVLITFYFIIYNIISKLFCLGLPDLSAWNGLDDKIITNSNVNDRLFIIGLPSLGKLSIILKKIETGEICNDKEPLLYNADDDASSNVFIADLINIPDHGYDREFNADWKDFKAKALDKKNKLIIVNHFEYNIKDAASNSLKLNFLEGLMLDRKCKIIILSTLHPMAFLDSVSDPSVKAGDKYVSGNDFDRWQSLLGDYRIVILFPLQHPKLIETENTWESSIYKETEYSYFLDKIRECAIEIAKGLPEKRIAINADEFALKLQGIAHYFYMHIWQSLTKEEKFLLYDLAEDNLVNSFDDYNLNMLLAKGVIIRPEDGGMLKLFNKGFRNFILTAIGNSEAMKIKNQIKETGNWSRLKNPLLIVVLAILTFLLISQQEAYSRLISYVAALGAGVPAILRLFSIFGKNGQKNS